MTNVVFIKNPSNAPFEGINPQHIDDYAVSGKGEPVVIKSDMPPPRLMYGLSGDREYVRDGMSASKLYSDVDCLNSSAGLSYNKCSGTQYGVNIPEMFQEVNSIANGGEVIDRYDEAEDGNKHKVSAEQTRDWAKYLMAHQERTDVPATLLKKIKKAETPSWTEKFTFSKNPKMRGDQVIRNFMVKNGIQNPIANDIEGMRYSLSKINSWMAPCKLTAKQMEAEYMDMYGGHYDEGLYNATNALRSGLFRQTSKLGLEYARDKNTVVAFVVSTNATLNNSDEIDVNRLTHKNGVKYPTKEDIKGGQTPVHVPITCSEMRHLGRNSNQPPQLLYLSRKAPK